MRKAWFVATVIFSVAAFSGCETVKSTLNGPVIGAKKDIANITPKVKEIHPIIATKRLDNWMQDNMW